MIRCIYSPFSDIYFHLAAEEYLLKQGNEDIFMLWQDTPSVVIGKHQRLRLEVDQEWAEREQVHIARRFSGGGAVYHDLGNRLYYSAECGIFQGRTASADRKSPQNTGKRLSASFFYAILCRRMKGKGRARC